MDRLKCVLPIQCRISYFCWIVQDTGTFCGTTDASVFKFWWPSYGFKARAYSLSSMLCHNLCNTWWLSWQLITLPTDFSGSSGDWTIYNVRLPRALTVNWVNRSRSHCTWSQCENNVTNKWVPNSFNWENRKARVCRKNRFRVQF